MPKKKPTKKSKRERLPPQTLQSFDTYLRNRGFRPDPLLEDPKDADKTYVKPLPKGQRQHIRVKKGRTYLTVEEHIDKEDPGRSMVGHFLTDMLFDEPESKVYRLRLKKPAKKKRDK